MKKIVYLIIFIYLLSWPGLVSAAGQYTYTVEYYYNGEISVNDTISSKGDWGSLVISYPDKKREGYTLSYSTIDAEGLTISDKEDYNVIKVFYVQEGSNDTPIPPKTGIEKKETNMVMPVILLIGLFLAYKKVPN